VKYALPGTRLYVTVTADTSASVTFRNISREPLDVSADELMERFVRGDSSRHTEGSGLGLSIARSLAESMGGSFQLSLDGDLFKATVSFPLAPANTALDIQA
jgi:signal transduction histidine kinase